MGRRKTPGKRHRSYDTHGECLYCGRLTYLKSERCWRCRRNNLLVMPPADQATDEQLRRAGITRTWLAHLDRLAALAAAGMPVDAGQPPLPPHGGRGPKDQ